MEGPNRGNRRNAPEPEPEGPSLSRRKFLKGAVKAAVGLTTFGVTTKLVTDVLHYDPLDKYAFLSAEAHPQPYAMGPLAGKKFAGLYADYLGIKSGSTVPEVLNIDFKANLAALWRKKFGFDKEGRSPKEERAFREQFVREHKDLMDFAEERLRGYLPDTPRKKTFGEYQHGIKEVITDVHRKLMHAMVILKAKDRRNFPDGRRLLIERLATQVDPDVLIACTLTELMPSTDGKTNAHVLDFLLQNAGEAFIDGIPSVHDMLPSLGPYQITPVIFAPGGAGTLAEKIEQELPKDFMPAHVRDVSGMLHHRVACLIDDEHIAHLAGMLSPEETDSANKHLDHTPPEALRKEMLAFITMAHHRPADTYPYFKDRLLGKPVGEIANAELRTYGEKAHANYAFLVERERSETA